jgi:DeoR/GlpR family transcriptional regulator of sugar metabolism
MNAVERQSKIVEIVMAEGSISIPGICRRFDVSDMTARRDLNELDRQGLLRRVRGGAVASLGRSYEPPFPIRAIKNRSAKAAIGLKAAELVYDGDSIALDVGTTTLEIVKGLKRKRNLTIVTSCLQIANRVVDTLSLNANVRLILTGGIVRPRELSMIGPIPEMVYRDLHVDKAFIGIGGISLLDAQTKQVLIQSAREKIVVADGSKFGVTTFATVAPLRSVDTIVADQSAPLDMVEQIRKLGVAVIIAA